MFTKLKIPLLVVALIAVAFFGYQTFFAKKDNASAPAADGKIASESSTATNAPTAANDADLASQQEALNQLLKVKNIKIDPSIFSDPAFISLRDSTEEIPSEPRGRCNPFAPIGQDCAGSPAIDIEFTDVPLPTSTSTKPSN